MQIVWEPVVVGAGWPLDANLPGAVCVVGLQICWLREELNGRQVSVAKLMPLMDEQRSGRITCGGFTNGLKAVGIALDSDADYQKVSWHCMLRGA